MAATWTLLDAISRTSTQATTESVPNLSTDGIPLDGVIGLTVWLDAGVGQTITGDVGQCDVYVFDNSIWGLAPAIVLPVPPGSSGQRRVSLGTVAIDNQRGRVAPICNGVSVSGANVTLNIMVTIDRRGISRAV